MQELSITIYFFITIVQQLSCQDTRQSYICPPCDQSCDEIIFKEDGVCPHCNMNLIMNIDSNEVNSINPAAGSGNFYMDGGLANKNKRIRVFYHQPKQFNRKSKILIVIPGTGRNGDNYRDAWISAAEKYNVLILAPSYAEKDYDYGAYHMGGLIYDLDVAGSLTSDPNTNHEFLKEEDFKFKVSRDPEEWIFNDFDRLFKLVVEEFGSDQTSYDMFGHSAGGQILHRMAIFQSKSQVDQILASNSGAYTLPEFDVPLPFGIGNSGITEIELKESFKKKLVLFIGELDNENEQGGLLLRSTTVDRQGIHRLARAKYFYDISEKVAIEMTSEFNWELEIVRGIGHDFHKMSEAAANYLYKIE